MAKAKRARKLKVPVKGEELKAVHLVCPNCGEEETRIIYCEACDAPLEVMDVVSMEEEEVKGNAGVKHDNGADKEDEHEDSVTSGDLLEEEEDVMENGLGDIFPGEDSLDNVSETEGFENIEDVVSALDEE